MAAVSLALFKKHVRADDFSDDDEYLEHLIETAEEVVVKTVNRSREELEKMGDGGFPAPLCQAVMMLGAHWYNQRVFSSDRFRFKPSWFKFFGKNVSYHDGAWNDPLPMFAGMFAGVVKYLNPEFRKSKLKG